jgi:tetratricopeptide (TPR) repeat protein
MFAMNCGQCEMQRGRWDSALQSFNEAIATIEPLVAEEGQRALADIAGEAQFEKGKTLEALGRPLDALSAYGAAREYLSEIVLRGGRSDLARALANVLRNEANLNASLGHVSEAVRFSDNAVGLFRRLAERVHNSEYLSLLSGALSVNCACLIEANRIDEAMAAAQEAVDLFRSLPPDDLVHSAREYAGVLMQFGVAARRAEDPQTTWGAYQEALKLLESLSDPEALKLKALIQFNSSNLLGDSGNLAESLRLLDDAIATWTELTHRLGPGFALENLVMARKAKTNQLLKIGALEDARNSSEEALTLLTEMVVKEGRSDLAEDLGKLWGGRALILKKLGDLEGAIAAFSESVKILKSTRSRREEAGFAAAADYMLKEAADLKRLAELRPNEVGVWSSRAQKAIEDGTQLSRSGDAFHACELFDDAILIYSVLDRRQPEERWARMLAQTQMQKAVAAMYSRRDRAAETAFRSAIDGYDRLIRDFRSAGDLANWGKSCLGLAVFLKTAGRVEESTTVVNTARERMRSRGGGEYREWEIAANHLLSNV